MTVWSYGGGTQSVAIAVLVAHGLLPRPERVVMADTSREASETWDYTETFVNPILGEVGLEIEVASHDLATVDLYSAKGLLLLPAYTGSGTGRLPAYCSSEWKKYVVARWLRANGYGPENPVRCWIGISVDEVHRAKPSGTRWLEYTWPLLFDLPHRRDECKSVVMRAGLPEPPKSSCWMCPYRSNAQWLHLKRRYPQDWQQAVNLDEAIRKEDPNVYLHRSGRPLVDADLGPESSQSDLFDGCDSGFCFV